MCRLAAYYLLTLWLMHAKVKGEVHAGNATYCRPAIPYLLYTCMLSSELLVRGGPMHVSTYSSKLLVQQTNKVYLITFIIIATKVSIMLHVHVFVATMPTD